MQTKLTLRLDDRLVRRAKAYARRSGRSVSSLVADFFALLGPGEEKKIEPELTPTVQSLLGALGREPVNEEEYYRYVEEKYG